MIITINNNIQQNKLLKSWLNLAIVALLIAGIFSILLVALRTPGVEKLIPYKNFFRKALIVHVDLSVLIWLMAMSSLLGEFIINDRFRKISKFSLYSCILGMSLIAISPFSKDSNAIINNYIPILENIVFIIGLSVFIAGSILHIIAVILSLNKIDLNSNLNLAILSTKLINIIAFISFFISSIKLSKIDYVIDSTYYYELLFWAKGHILQFSYINLMMIAWLFLSEFKDNLMIKICFILNFIFSVISLLSFFIYEIDSAEFKEYYTMHMRYLGGIAPTLIATAILYNITSQKRKLPASIISSFTLFFIGGLIGIIITSSNVTIPAHYHGSIVGVTLALMGLTYMMIKLLYNSQINNKIVSIQSYLYGGGQLLHIIGLAWSGGYGALRKTPGAELSYKAKLGMGLMGFGGLIAIIAGIIFVTICLKTILKTRSSKLTDLQKII